jgi:hypothetical protein
LGGLGFLPNPLVVSLGSIDRFMCKGKKKKKEDKKKVGVYVF